MLPLDALFAPARNLSKPFLAVIFAGAFFGFLRLAAYAFFPAVDGVVQISCNAVVPWAVVLGILGYGSGYAALRSYGKWNEAEEKVIGIGVIGLLFFSNTCVSNCLPSAFITTAFSAIGLVPILAGAAFARFMLASSAIERR